MKFLKELAEGSLPVVIYQTDLINQVRRYVSAGLVTASLPSDLRAQSSTKMPAQILKITDEGKRVLKKHLKRLGWC